jgi:uncharacterized alpha-E superfamily protein
MLLSSSAETMLWAGRYLERAQSLARAVLASERAYLDLPGRTPADLRRLLPLVGGDRASVANVSEFEAIHPLVFDTQNPSSVSGALERGRENLRRGRVATPPEVWAVLNSLHARHSGAEPGSSIVGASSMLEDVVASCMRIEGEIVAGMTRDAAYSFLRLGTFVERADMLLRVTQVLVSALDPNDEDRLFDDVRWIGVLRAVGAHAMYRRRHHTNVDLPRILEFLVLDESFPRSLAYCFTAIEAELRALPPNPRALVVRHNSHQIVSALAGASAAALPAEVSRVLATLGALYAAVKATYFPGESAAERREARGAAHTGGIVIGVPPG